MFAYLLFDLDGTLTDPAEGITKSVQYALQARGIEEPDLKKLERFIGPPLRDSFVEFYGMTPEEAEESVAKYRERYMPVGVFENEIYPGIAELLKCCKAAGKKLAVASSKPQTLVDEVLRHFNITQYFDIVMGCELDGTRGKKEEVVEEVLRLFELIDCDREKLKKEAVMIGDRKFDITGGRFFGLSTIGVRFGYAEEGELEAAGADYVVDSVAELEELLI